jgi:UDP-N-acetylmuramoyl-L-alanyl-D-glutamate--2,6-diaminopimelate ligase
LRDRIVITYGLDLRATITTSSVPMRDEVTLICCLQRGITTLEGEDIEPMEFPIKFYYHDQFTVNNVLPVIALALRYGTSVENLQEILSKYKGRI